MGFIRIGGLGESDVSGFSECQVRGRAGRRRTPHGRGRIYQPGDGFNGVIELIGWDTLVDDAREPNKAFFDRIGLTGKSYFSST